MPITITNGSNGLFDLLGLAFHAINTIDTSVATTGTIGTAVQNLLTAASAQTAFPFQGMTSAIPAAQTSGQTTGVLASTIASTCQTILEAFITKDGGTPSGLQNDLTYLINDMANHTSVGHRSRSRDDGHIPHADDRRDLHDAGRLGPGRLDPGRQWLSLPVRTAGNDHDHRHRDFQHGRADVRRHLADGRRRSFAVELRYGRLRFGPEYHAGQRDGEQPAREWRLYDLFERSQRAR